jgi:hypothetical protein
MLLVPRAGQRYVTDLEKTLTMPIRRTRERQRAYRQRRLKDLDANSERINLVVSANTKRKLERLAACYGVTETGMLEPQ